MNCQFSINGTEYQGKVLSNLPQRKINGIIQSGVVEILLEITSKKLQELIVINDSTNDVNLRFEPQNNDVYEDVGFINLGKFNGSSVSIKLLPRNCWHIQS
jgi:hypothetical protein